ncbi:MAG: hypothetical protein Q9M17_09245 [Mariprofundus sp.]|nr:hypothetical protein [Mariprofundus sp.]
MNSEKPNVSSAREEFINWVLKRNADIPMSEIEFLIGPDPDCCHANCHHEAGDKMQAH